jgi:hypothetical protein
VLWNCFVKFCPSRVAVYFRLGKVSDVANNGYKSESEIVVNKTITISIGRAIGTTPMSTKEWRRFIRLVNVIVKDTVAKDCLWVHNAKSHNAYNGNPEETRTWVFDTDLSNLERIDAELLTLTDDFVQDCIARTVGKTRLVGIE